MRRSTMAFGFAFLALPAALAAAQTTTFVATLDEAQEVPAPTPAGASGSGTFVYDSGTTAVTYTVNATLSGTGGTAAEVRFADFGQQGGLVFALTGGPTSWSGTSPALTPVQASALFEGRFYVTIPTALNPNGEIRGQIAEQSVLNARTGNVNTVGGDPPAVVLTVGGSSGHPIYRSLTRSAGPATIELALPPAGGSGHYAIWIFPGESNRTTLSPCIIANGQGGTESIGNASYCLPANNTATPGSCPCPTGPFPLGFTSKRIIGNAVANALCLHRIPADPRPPTTLLVDFPIGKWTVLGVMFDPNARTIGPRLVSLTNSVTVVAQ